ncbi:MULTISPECIES: ATP-binding cassette domain-containing protein [Streptomyces]|uniref:ATP-binding cassette domain-containing protein n=1 Tax=Streptomyces TaxID=1883 RepID=UPI0022493BC2|nr:ABC transporter ATP-binding protein [Streptomyces sp. JHD 1]MCX2967832.1 ABC transporter ATP-binding protein [Streptomyces sp. JHD 1]
MREAPAGEDPARTGTGRGEFGARGLLAAGARRLWRRPRALGALAGWSVVEAAQTLLLGLAVAHSLDDGFLRGDAGAGLAWLGVGALGVLVGAVGTGRVYRAVADLAEPLRDLLVERVVGSDLHAAVRRGRARDSGAVSRLTHQVEIARDSFAGLLMAGRAFVFTSAAALVGMASLHPLLLLVVVPPLVLGLAVFGFSLRPLARRQRDFLVADEAIAEHLSETAGGLRDVVAAGAQAPTRARARAHVDAERRAAGALARWGVSRAVALGVGGRLPVVLLLLLTPWLLSRGVSTGALAGALTYLLQSLLPALESLVHGLGNAGARLAVVVGRLRGTGGAAPPAVPHPPPAPRDPGAALELRGVSFAYGRRAHPVLDGVDLSLPRGGHLAVVGPSGIGKSTLAQLLAGLLAPSAGHLAVRGPVALVPQEAYVFSGTLRANLAYLCRGPVGDAVLHRALRATGAAALAARLGGLDAEVAPDRLSAGERQLLALARAYAAPAPLVVLDEATCHLDPAAEARAEAAFRARSGTLVVIAHRMSSARRADRVLVLDGARARCGTPAELAKTSALYRELAGSWDGTWSAPGEGSGGGEGTGGGATPGAENAPGDEPAHGRGGESGTGDESGAGDEPGGEGAAGTDGPAAARSEPAGALGDADGVHPVAGSGLPGDR